MNHLIHIAVFSGLGAGLVAIIATLAIERLGGQLGGIIGTLPTTIIPASWGLWQQHFYDLSMNPTEYNSQAMLLALEHFSAAMYAVPAGMCLNAIFLWFWRFIPRHSLWIEEQQKRSTNVLKAVAIMSIVTLSIWLVGAVLWVTFSRYVLLTSDLQLQAGIVASLLIVILGGWATFTQEVAPKGANKVSLKTLLLRGVCAASAVATAVLISKTGASTFSGVAAVFPAIFWTTMVSLWLSQGQAVPAGAVGPMMLGSSSVAIFALSAPSSYILFGPFIGSLLSWFISACFASVPSYFWLKSRQKTKEKN